MAQTAKVIPDSWMPKGEARVPGKKPMAVWCGIPGERARVKVVHRGNNQDHALWLGPVDGPHPTRRAPVCEKYEACGGCPLMHVTPPGQAKALLGLVAQSLEHVGLRQHAPSSLAASPDGEVGFRHVVKVGVDRTEKGHLRIGAFGRRNRRIVAIPDCPVATPGLRRAMAVLAHAAIELEVEPFRAGRGVLRYAIMRQSRASGQVLVTLVAGRNNRTLRDLAERIEQDHGDVAGVHLHINSEHGNALLVPDEEGVIGTLKLAGADVIEDQVAGYRLRIGPADFFQTNPGMGDALVRDVVEAFEPWADRPVVDLYCGVGAFTVPLAAQHGWAFGVEQGVGAVARARDNARLNKVKAEFASGEVGEVLPELSKRVQGAAVLVDPARAGLEPGVIDQIEAIQPAVLGYVSCNHQALARDLSDLSERGWTVRSIKAYNMFPQAAHLELFALLTPPGPAPEARRPQRRLVR